MKPRKWDLKVFCIMCSFKFLRIFPLSQFDLPTSRPTLTFADPLDSQQKKSNLKATEGDCLIMTKEMLDNNPAVSHANDYLSSIISNFLLPIFKQVDYTLPGEKINTRY